MERKQARDERLVGVETAITEIKERQAQRQEAAVNLLAAEELCRAARPAPPLLSAQLTFREKCEILQAVRVRAVANLDGTITVSAVISQDILTLSEREQPVLSEQAAGVV
jgi:hypothetical protein